MVSNQKSSHVYNAMVCAEVVNSKKNGNKPLCRRNPDLILQRNILLAHRFYFKSKVQRKPYQDVVKELHEEFFLSAVQIQKLINANGDEILKIKKQQPSLPELKKKYPHVSW